MRDHDPCTFVPAGVSSALALISTMAMAAPAPDAVPTRGGTVGPEARAAAGAGLRVGAQDQETERPVVGTIEMVIDGEPMVFDVREGPPGEGFSTGYSVQPRGEAMVIGAGLHGWERSSGSEILVSVAFWRESLKHMCDPFANQVRFEGRRLRPGEEPSETCPPPADGGRGGLAIRINLTDASIDEEDGTVHLSGTFSGPLGRGEDALQVADGRFEGTLRPYEELQ